MYGPVRTVLWEDGPLRGASYPTEFEKTVGTRGSSRGGFLGDPWERTGGPTAPDHSSFFVFFVSPRSLRYSPYPSSFIFSLGMKRSEAELMQ